MLRQCVSGYLSNTVQSWYMGSHFPQYSKGASPWHHNSPVGLVDSNNIKSIYTPFNDVNTDMAAIRILQSGQNYLHVTNGISICIPSKDTFWMLVKIFRRLSQFVISRHWVMPRHNQPTNHSPIQWRLGLLADVCVTRPQWTENGAHHSDVIMSVMASQLTGVSSVQAQIKENTKAPCHRPLWGELTGHRWIPAQRASNAENVSIWWRHHEKAYFILWHETIPTDLVVEHQTHWNGVIRATNYERLNILRSF